MCVRLCVCVHLYSLTIFLTLSLSLFLGACVSPPASRRLEDLEERRPRGFTELSLSLSRARDIARVYFNECVYICTIIRMYIYIYIYLYTVTAVQGIAASVHVRRLRRVDWDGFSPARARSRRCHRRPTPRRARAPAERERGSSSDQPSHADRRRAQASERAARGRRAFVERARKPDSSLALCIGTFLLRRFLGSLLGSLVWCIGKGVLFSEPIRAHVEYGDSDAICWTSAVGEKGRRARSIKGRPRLFLLRFVVRGSRNFKDF